MKEDLCLKGLNFWGDTRVLAPANRFHYLFWIKTRGFSASERSICQVLVSRTLALAGAR